MLSLSTQPLMPLGSLVYTEAIEDSISVASETDSFTLDLDPGQTITVLVEPAAELQPIIELFDPTNTSLGSASSAAAGQDAVLQPVATTGAGTYTFTVGGAAGTLGNYNAQVILNAAVEDEQHDGPTNDSIAEAQDLSASFLSLGHGTSERSAGLGRGDDRDLGALSQTQNNNVFYPNVLTFDFSGAPTPLGAGVLTLSTISDLGSSSEYLTLAAEGLLTQDLFVNDGGEQSFASTTVNLTQAQLATLFADDGAITFTVTPSFYVDNLGPNYLTLELSYPTAPPTTDFYSFSLLAGQSASLALASQDDGSVALELQDASGNLLTTGTAAGNVDQVINNFVATVNGTYYANVIAGTSEYSLVVTRDADFDSEPNDAPAPDAQDISVAGSVLGTLAGVVGNPEQDSNLITNGSFETGDFTGWTIDTTGEPFLPWAVSGAGLGSGYGMSPTEPQDGAFVAWNSFDGGGPMEFVMYQDVLLPATSTALELSWQDRAQWEFFAATEPRLYDVEVRDPVTDAVLATLFTFSTGVTITSGNTGWQTHSADLSAFAGQTVRLTFREQIPESFTGPAQIEFDAISLIHEPDDYYTLEANAGDLLSVEVTIPAAGPGEFVNHLDVSIELLDPNGVVVANTSTQTNITFTHTALLTGAYAVRLFTDSATSGEYVLEVSGHSGSLPPFEVIASVPANGDIFAELTRPAQMTIDLSSSVLATSVEAADLTVDGAAATGVTIVDGDTLVFDLPVLAEGSHNATITAAALTSLQNAPLENFSSQFTFDFTAPRIIDSSIQDGDIVSAGLLAYTVQFDEPLRETDLDADVVTLVDSDSGNQFSPTVFDYDNNSSTLTLEYADLPESFYTLTLLSGDGLLEDIAGNNLDGEIVTSPIGPNVSGDGFAGGNFTIEFFADHSGAVPVPVPLSPITPLGSLVYQGGVAGRINTSQDIDQYSIDIDAGQAITLVVEGSNGLTPIVILETPGFPITATATAAGPDQAAVLQTLPTVTSGTYLISIHGDGIAPGDYTLQVLLNSAVEEESFDGPDNGSIATSQVLDLAFVEYGSLGAERGAVLGTTDQDPGIVFSETLFNSNVQFPNVLNMDFNGVPSTSGSATLSLRAFADLGDPSEYLTIEAEGIALGDVFVNDGLDFTNVTTTIDLTQAQMSALAADGTASFTITPSADVYEPGTITSLFVTLDVEGSRADFYSFSLAAGQSASLALTRLESGTPALELLDAAGNLLTTGIGAANVDQVINNFVSVAGGTYYANVSGGNSEYSLVVTRSADFDSEPNNDSANVQDIGGILGALGHLVGIPEEAPTPASALPALSPSASHAEAAEPLPEVNLPYLPSIDSPFRGNNQQKASLEPIESKATYAEDAALRLDNAVTVSARSAVANASTIVGPIPILQTFAGPVINGGVPPDPIAAAGPEQVIAIVNTQIAIYDKTTGDELFLESLNGSGGFFGSVGATDVIFDPWILFDTETDRFFAIGIDIPSSVESNVFLAVSTDATPTSGADWHKYKLDFTHIADGTGLGSGAHFPDYPKLGVGDDAIWISGNYFPIASGTGVYAGITAIEKDPLLAGGSANVVYEEHFDGFSVMPMTQYDSPGTQYFAEASTGSGSSITIHALTDVLTSPVRSTTSVNVPSFVAPVDVPQLGGGALADSIDARVMTGVWRDGSMWFAHAITDPAVDDGESLVRWYEFSTDGFPDGGTPILVQSGNVDPGPGEHAWMPAVAVDGNGNLGIGFSMGGANQYYGAGFTGRLATDPLGETVLPVTQYAAGLGNYQLVDGIGRNRWGDYSGISVDPADDATFWVFNEYATANNTWATQIASFQLQQPEDEDWYQFAVLAGDILRIETFTPSNGPLELVNELDVSIELIDPQGNVIPYANRAGNELIFHVAQSTGQYRLRLFAEASEGEYFVQIEGATGSSLPPFVIDTNPDVDSVLGQFPQTYTLSFSEGLFMPSLEASDLRIGGLPALSVTPIDGATFNFQIDPAANVGDGIYSVELPAGEVSDLQGLVNDAFLTTFELDTTGPVILATLWNGQPMLAAGIYQEGSLTFTAMFSEDLFLAGSARRGPFTPGTDDVVLVDHFSGTTYTPLSVDYDPDTDLLEATFQPLPEGDYELTLISGDGGLEDLVGNDLDGEPLGLGFDGTVTGDGVPGGDYTVSFGVDRISTALEPWAAWEPLGSMMYASRDNTGLVNAAGDQDLFQFFLEGGQKLAAVLTPRSPTAVLSLELLGLTATMMAPEAGATVVLPLTDIPAAALFEMRVSGNTKSGYDLDLYRNAAVETTVTDTDAGNPLALDSSLLTLGGSLAGGRYGIVGRSDAVPGSAPPIAVETEPNDDGVPGDSINDLPWANDWSGSFEIAGRARYQAVLTGSISAGFDADWDFFKILAGPGDSLELDLRGASSGVGTLVDPYLRLYDNTGTQIAYDDDSGIGFLESHLVYNNFTAAGDYYVVAGSYGGSAGSYQLTGTLRTSNPLWLVQGNPDTDFYTLDLSDQVGQRLDVILSGEDGTDFTTSTLELLDDAGNVLATAASDPLGSGGSAANFDLGILDFVVPDLGSNLYTLRFDTEQPGGYGIVVTDAIVFDTEPNNDTTVPLRNLDEVSSALGFLDIESIPPSGLVEPDDFPPGTILNHEISGVTLSVLDSTLDVTATTSFHAPTGAQAFGRGGLDYWGGFSGEALQANFSGPVDQVSIVVGSDDDSDISFLRAFHPNGQLLQEVVSSSLGSGQTETLTITRPANEIAYITAGAVGGDLVFLDRLEFNSTVATLLPGDTYQMDLLTGQNLHVFTETLLDHPLSTPAGDLNPSLTILDPDGQIVAFDSDSLDGKNAELHFTASAGGTYAIQVQAESGTGTYLLNTSKGALPADFDDDNDIDGFDFLAWQRGFAMASGADPADGDANGDGAVDGQDKDQWEESFGATQPEDTTTVLASNTASGDFDGDHDSDGNDFLAWQRGYGKTSGAVPDGDADGNDTVDGQDLTYWEASFETTGQIESSALNQPILFTLMEPISPSDSKSAIQLEVNRLTGPVVFGAQSAPLPRPADFWSTFEPIPLEFDGEQLHAQTAAQPGADIPRLSRGGVSGTTRNLVDLTGVDRTAEGYSNNSAEGFGELLDAEYNDLALAHQDDWRFVLG